MCEKDLSTQRIRYGWQLSWTTSDLSTHLIPPERVFLELSDAIMLVKPRRLIKPVRD